MAARRLAFSVAAVLFAAAGPAMAVSQLELYGTMTSPGTVKAGIFALSPGAGNLEWTLGTWSHSGGTLPGGGGVGAGGIDANLSIAQNGTALASSDNLSAANRDAEIHTSNVTGRPGSTAIAQPQNWAGYYDVTMGVPSGGSLGNGNFSLVSYLPGSGDQVVDSIVASGGAKFTGLNANDVMLHVIGSPLNIQGAASFTGSQLSLADADFSVTARTQFKNSTSLAIAGSGVFRADYVDFGYGTGDRSTISITGSGGIEMNDLNVGIYHPDAAVTIDQRNGSVKLKSLTMDRPDSPAGATSHYWLRGGSLAVSEYLALNDAVIHIDGGSFSLPSFQGLPAGTFGSKIVWSAGHLTAGEVVDGVATTSGFFGGSVDLTPGRTLAVNAKGLTSFVNLAGGKLSVRELADNGLSMDWQRGELELFGTAGASLAAGRALGDQLILGPSKTLRLTAGTLTVDSSARLLIADGGRASLFGLTNGGEINLGGVGQASLDLTGPSALQNSGLLVGNGRVSGAVLNNAPGRIEANDGQTLRIAGSISNNGQIRVVDGTLAVSTMLLNNTAGKVTGHGTFTAAAIENRGAITFTGGGSSDVDVSLFTNKGGAKTIVTGGSNATFYGNVTNEAGSEFRISADSRATFLGSVTHLGAFTGTGMKIFEGNATGAMLATAGGSSVVEAGGTLMAAGVRESSLTLRGRATIADGSAVSRLQTLTIDDGGQLDLRNNALVVDFDAAAPSPLASIRAAVTQGVLFSSNLDGRQAFVVLDGNALGNLRSVGGVSLDSTSILIAAALRGDADVDGKVEFDDLLTLAKNYNATGRTWTSGDFDGDARTNFNDLLALAKNYGRSLSSGADAATFATDPAAFAADFALAQSLVPEPGSACAMLLGMGLIARRRRSA